MKKYLCKFGYIGTRFSGVQKNRVLGVKDNSIGRYLDESLLTLSLLNSANVSVSSRTDAGVHAIGSTFHTELCLPYVLRRGIRRITKESNVTFITKTLNGYFNSKQLDIRIHSTREVPFGFHSRHSAVKRTYMYRLAHFTPRDGSAQKYLPLPEMNRCLLISGGFDLKAVEAACLILKGHHDFSYFTNLKKLDTDTHTHRTLDEVKIVPGRPLFPSELDRGYDHLQFWDVIVEARSFLYNQVRRMVALLLSVGNGLSNLSDVENALLHPNTEWNPLLHVVDPDGLHLLEVEYPPEAFLEETYQRDANEEESSVSEKGE